MPRCRQCGEDLKDGARFCSECGTTVSSVPLAPIESKPPQFSGYSDIPKPKKTKRLIPYSTAATLLVLVFLLGLIFFYFTSSKTSPEANDQGSISPTLPATESSFIQTVVKAREDSQAAANDMQKGGIKAIRDRTLCNTLTSLAVSDWVGTVKTVDSNSDGKGVLAIEIAPDVLVKTWNNDLSDIGSNTLIEPGTAVFTAASAMKSGQLVSFSGNFLSGVSGDCVSESSLTLDGKLQSPEFVFRFASVSSYDPSQQASAVPAASKPTADTPMPATIEPDEPQQQQPAPIGHETGATADTLGDNTVKAPPAGVMSGYLDKLSITPNGRHQMVTANGWAADTENQRLAENVTITVDGTPSCNATMNDLRQDVADVHGAAYANSGWHCDFALQDISVGKHQVEAWATWHVGDKKYKAMLGDSKTITAE